MEFSERKKPLNRDAIKYIAMFTMFLNHFSYIFLTQGTFWHDTLTNIGYFTAVTMCYFLVEGYGYTRSKRKYGLRLLGFALLSQLPFMMLTATQGYFRFIGFNMIFTLLLCFLILVVDERIENRWGRVLLKALLLLASCFCDWAIFAPVFTMLFLWAGKDRKRIAVSYMIAAVSFGCASLNALSPLDVLQAAVSALGIVASGICILYLYNGRRAERGRTFSQWFFYLFYPVHLLALGLLRIALM